ANRLRDWVANGGTLVSEGCPAYFDERGHAGVRQPNLGLSDLFGALEGSVEFTPDLLDDLRLTVDGQTAWGGIFFQTYQPTTGTAPGWYEDGQLAAVDTIYGKGRTRLIGSMTGYGHGQHDNGPISAHSTPFFASLLDWAGQPQHVRSSDARIKARIHAGEGGN